MPLPAKGSNASSTTDYEQLSYDAAGNVTSRRLRDAQTIAFTYDNLNRATLKNLPGSEPDVTYGYDNLGRLTSASQTGNSLSFSYDALSRNLTQAGPQGTVASQWDIGGRRTRLTYPDGFYVDYGYDNLGRLWHIRENGAASGVGVLATFAYDGRDRPSTITMGNGVVQAFTYDPISRLASLTNDLAGTANDLGATFAYNPASQITSTVRTGDAYAWTGHFNQNRTGTANGLNQLTSVGPKNLTHDARGNVTAFGTKSFTYSSENLLLTGPASTTLSYDSGMRLYQSVSGGTTLRLAYDGLDRIAEYNGSNTLQRRYVHGPGMDQPLVQYEGSGTSGRRFLSSDERGSIISLTDTSGALLGINRYDEFGNPQGTNLGAFGYTGQAWLQGISVAYYKARAYDPELGRFLQTDPIDMLGGINLYAYVLNDPVNWTDPLGLVQVCITGPGVNPRTGEVDEDSSVRYCYEASIGSGSGSLGGAARGNPFVVFGGVGQSRPPAPPQLRNIILPEKCSMAQNAGQWLGDKIGKLGAFGTNVGLAGTAVGLGTTAVGVGVGATGNLPAGLEIGFVGLAITEKSAELTALSGFVTVGGATISAFSGSGKPAIVEGLTRLSTKVIPSGPIKDFVSEAISKGLNAVVPEVRACTP